jgi:hypothetical protein
MRSAKTVAAGILSLLVVALLISLFLKTTFHEPHATPQSASPGGTLWDSRNFETILQGLLILSGVFATLMLLRSSTKETKQ